MLDIENLHFAYNTAPILRGLSLRVGRGETVVLRGPSGSGKSTLLRLIARLEDVPPGSIRLDGDDITGLPPTQYRRRVAYLQQVPVMAPDSVRDNLLLPWRYGGDAEPEDDHLRGLLEEVELGDVALSARATELSVGQQQRIALLRLLSMEPDFLLLDEPTASLDPDSATQLLRALARRREASVMTVLIVAHHALPLDGMQIRTVRLREGRVEHTEEQA